MDGNKAISQKTVTVTIGTQKYTSTTNKDGYYSISYKPTTIGTNKITLSYDGNDKYSKVTSNTTLTVN